MQARDSSGRQVSLLNDDHLYYNPPPPRISYRAVGHVPSRPYATSRSSSSSPNTPELLRSDSYDSNTSNDPISPMTPSVAYDYSRTRLYSTSSSYDDYGSDRKRPSYADGGRSNSYEDDASLSSIVPDRTGKRYPCRYRESHGCEKTFTTSGHASRHSKIHTAEKAVQCTFSGCHKKFTRADNMKQHLETHYKERSRPSASQRPGKSSSGRTSGSSRASRDHTSWEAEYHGQIANAPHSPSVARSHHRGVGPPRTRPAHTQPSQRDADTERPRCAGNGCGVSGGNIEKCHTRFSEHSSSNIRPGAGANNEA